MTNLDRRSFLRNTGLAVAGGVTAAGPLSALLAQGASADRVRPVRGRRPLRAPDNASYGALQPTPTLDTGELLLSLPAGFEYVAFGRTGEMGSDGFPTPSRHDGMATFAGPSPTSVRLVRNHEIGYSPTPFEGSGDEPLVGDPSFAYDRSAGGACTNLVFDTASFRMTDSFISINGTSVNCAGGSTPWGSWLTCEETTNGPEREFTAPGDDEGPIDPALRYDNRHGYIFEVPAGDVAVQDPIPLVAMGRFVHEAVAIDPTTGVVYETEDRGSAGFYRFVPVRPGNLEAGGRLQMLSVRGRFQYDTRTGQRIGERLITTWVDIPDPDPADATLNSSAVYTQGFDQGGATFARLEGAWYGDGSIFFNSTSGGDAGLGQVWEYRPRGRDGGLLTLVFESPSADVLDSPDNITVSPRGGLVLCEDGDDEQFLRGITVDGQIFDFAQNIVSEDEDKEFAGATFSPDGQVLFVNIQTPGLSFAIRPTGGGSWREGAI